MAGFLTGGTGEQPGTYNPAISVLIHSGAAAETLIHISDSWRDERMPRSSRSFVTSFKWPR